MWAIWLVSLITVFRDPPWCKQSHSNNWIKQCQLWCHSFRILSLPWQVPQQKEPVILPGTTLLMLSFTDLVRRPVEIKRPVNMSNHSGTSDYINKGSGAFNFKAKYKDQWTKLILSSTTLTDCVPAPAKAGSASRKVNRNSATCFK